MKRLLLGLGLVVALCAQVGFNLPGWPPVQPTVASGPPTFTSVDGPYFVAATGCSDANNGLSSGSPWCSLNHAVNCGDVIIFAAGTYTTAFSTFGTVSNCPSTTGGIDGSGGVYFAIAVCGGADLEACKINTSSLSFDMTKNNWAVEGMKVNNSGAARAFTAHETTGTNIIHDFAWVNNVIVNSNQAIGTNDDNASNHNTNDGIDYMFAVGNIAQNAAQDSICLAAIDFVAPAQSDTNAGTHLYGYGNFAIANNTSATCASDMESFMLDTPDAHGFSQQLVIANNISVKATRNCVQLFGQNFHTITPTIKVYNNTCFADLTNVGTDGADGSVNLNMAGGIGNSWPTTIQNNIAQTNSATSNGHPIYAGVFGGGLWSSLTIGGTGNENIFKGLNTTCPGGASCDAGHNVAAFNSNGFGTNTYIDAGFNNTTDLLANWLGAPTCTGFITTTECMGYDPNTATLTSNTVIYDLVPTSTGTAGKGYQLPSTTCAANSDYPTKLKGIVVLHWDGTKITERPDLVTKPCNL